MEDEKKVVETEVKEEKGTALKTINTDLFGESKAKRVTSLDLSNDDDVNLYLAAQSEADYKLNDCVGKIIEVTDFIAGEYPKEDINKETGEVVIRKNHSLCLFDKDGKSYVTGSGTCYYSFATIVALKGEPTKVNPLKFEVVKTPAKEAGHNYLKLKLAK